MPSEILQIIRDAMPEPNRRWFHPESGGMGEDNDMTAYRYDIIYTRAKFRRVADDLGMKRPYRFERRDFEWIERDEYYWELMGKLVLIDKNGNEFESDKMTWKTFYTLKFFWKLKDKDKPYYIKNLISPYRKMIGVRK